jgi:hypothetical protein
MLALYRMLLCLYPAEYRSEYAEEMITVFREARGDERGKKLASYSDFCLRELAGLLRGAVREHLQRLTGSDRSRLFSSRRFTMCSAFRFPRSTWVLMTIILAGVIMAIEKASAIAESLPHSNPHLPPIQPASYAHLQGLVTVFAAVYLLAGLVWALLFALRRSGLHRLSALNTPHHG